MKLPPLRVPRIRVREMSWRTAPWGKIVGGAFGLSAGVFGMILGLVVGHLVDELLWAYLVRRLLRRFVESAEVVPDLAPLAGPLAALVLLFDEAQCGGERTPAATGPVIDYLRERHGTGRRQLRMLELAGEEAAGPRPGAGASDRSGEAPARQERFLALLQTCLSPNDRAEFVWLSGRVAREVGGCARGRAEEMAQRLGIDAQLVADGARREGALDERACMLLGVPQDADRDQIRRSYRRLAAEFHPDVTYELDAHQRMQAQEAFVRIRTAYEQLMRELGEEP